MKKIFISMIMLVTFDCCVGMKQPITETEKLTRITSLSTDVALGRSGVDSELFSLTGEFKTRVDEKFYTPRMLYAELALAGYVRDNEVELSEAIDILIEMTKKMDDGVFFDPLRSERITWRNTGLRDTLIGDLSQIRVKHKRGEDVSKSERLFNPHSGNLGSLLPRWIALSC